MEVVPQETETVDDAAHVEDRLPSCCLTSAFQNATSRLPAAMKVAASDAMLGHLEELSACLDAACRGHVDEAGFARMWTAAHAAKEITPSSPPIKDLAQSVRNIVLCHILSTVGYTSRARVEAKICAIFGAERLELLDNSTEPLVWLTYESLVGKLPGAFPSKLKASGRPPRVNKKADKEACTQTDEATFAQTGEETPACGFYCLYLSI